MIQLNLLPDVKKEFLRAEAARRKTIAISILITVIVVGLTILFAFYVYAVQRVIVSIQTDDIKKKSIQLNNIKDLDKYLAIQNQLASLSSLHGDKNNFSRLLDFLPQLNPAPPQNVTISDLEIKATDSTIDFKGTVGNFGALTTFKDTLQNATYVYTTADGTTQPKKNLFSKVVINSAVYQNTNNKPGVTFEVIVTYDDALFKQANKAVTITIPNKETTGSVVGSPQAIFGEDANGNQ